MEGDIKDSNVQGLKKREIELIRKSEEKQKKRCPKEEFILIHNVKVILIL